MISTLMDTQSEPVPPAEPELKHDARWLRNVCGKLPLEINLQIQYAYLLDLHVLELLGLLHTDDNWDELIKLIFQYTDINIIEKIDLKLVCQLSSVFGEIPIETCSTPFEKLVIFLESKSIFPGLINFYVNTGISRRRSTFPFYHLNYNNYLRRLVRLARKAGYVELDHEDIDDIHKYGLCSKFTSIGFSLDYYSRNWLSENGFLRLSKFINLDTLCLKVQDQMDLDCATELMKKVAEFADFKNSNIPKRFKLVKVEPSPQGNRTSIPLELFVRVVREVTTICQIPVDVVLSRTLFSYRDPHDSIDTLTGYLKDKVTGLSITINSAKRPGNDNIPTDYLLWLRHLKCIQNLSIIAYGMTVLQSLALLTISKALKSISLYRYVQFDSTLASVVFSNLTSVHLEECHLFLSFFQLLPDRLKHLHILDCDYQEDPENINIKLPTLLKTFQWRNASKLPYIVNLDDVRYIDEVSITGLSLDEIKSSSFDQFDVTAKTLKIEFINSTPSKNNNVSLDSLNLKKMTRIENLKISTTDNNNSYQPGLTEFHLSCLPQNVIKLKLNIPLTKIKGSFPPSLLHFAINLNSKSLITSLNELSHTWKLHSLVITSELASLDLSQVNLNGIRILLVKMEDKSSRIIFKDLPKSLIVFNVDYSVMPYSESFRLVVPEITNKMKELHLDTRYHITKED